MDAAAAAALGPTPEPTSGIDRLVAQARTRFERLEPVHLEAELASGALVVDTRCAALRERDGALPGAVVVERNVLEWRLDPTSAHRLPDAGPADRRIVVVCDEGYSSSLAAATLVDLGLVNATDLVGGFQVWRRLYARHRPGPLCRRREADTATRSPASLAGQTPTCRTAGPFRFR